MKMTYRQPAQFSRGKGFTLTELLIALSVGAILLTMAVPSFSEMLERNRISSAADQLYASLAQARGEAVKRRLEVTVCPSADSDSCRNDGDWSEGWLVFQDANSDGSADADEIIRAVPYTSLADGLSIGCELGCESGAQKKVIFRATGSARDDVDDNLDVEFSICHTDSTAASKEIAISPSGRIEYTTLEQTGCSAS